MLLKGLFSINLELIMCLLTYPALDVVAISENILVLLAPKLCDANSITARFIASVRSKFDKDISVMCLEGPFF